MRVLVSSVFSLWLLPPVSSLVSPSLFLLGSFWGIAVETALGNTRGCDWESGAEDHLIYIDIFFTEVFCTQLFVHNKPIFGVPSQYLWNNKLINSPLYRRLYLYFSLLIILCSLKFL